MAAPRRYVDPQCPDCPHTAGQHFDKGCQVPNCYCARTWREIHDQKPVEFLPPLPPQSVGERSLREAAKESPIQFDDLMTYGEENPIGTVAFTAVNELVHRLATAEHERREAWVRDAIVQRVRDALWTELRRQSDSERFGAWIDRDREIIDGRIDMKRAADAAVDVFVELLRDPPTIERHPDGTEKIRWPEGDR